MIPPLQLILNFVQSSVLKSGLDFPFQDPLKVHSGALEHYLVDFGAILFDIFLTVDVQVPVFNSSNLCGSKATVDAGSATS